jgi:hypothetical protein
MSTKNSTSRPRRVTGAVAVIALVAFLVGGSAISSNAWTDIPPSLENAAQIVANQYTYGWNPLPLANNRLEVPSADDRLASNAVVSERGSVAFVGREVDAANEKQFGQAGGGNVAAVGLESASLGRWGAYAVLGKKYSKNVKDDLTPSVVPLSTTVSTSSGPVDTSVVTELNRDDGAKSFTFPLYDKTQTRQSWFTDLEQVSKFSSFTEVDVPAKTQSYGNAQLPLALTVQQDASQVDDLVLISEHYRAFTINARYLLVDELIGGKLNTFKFYYGNYPKAYAKYNGTDAGNLCAKSMMVEYVYKALAKYHCVLPGTQICAAASAAATPYRNLGYNICAPLGLSS